MPMPIRKPMSLYRPTKVVDATGGGFTLTLVLNGTVWGRVTVHQDTTQVVGVDRNEDVQVGDLLAIDETF